MGVRYFCDHCGNTVHQLKRLSYGDCDAEIAASHRASAAFIPSVGIHAKAVTLVRVELCDHCVPIWMERVANLCRQSDDVQHSQANAK